MKQTRRVRSRSPVIQGSAENSTVRLGNVDEDVVVSFPDFRGQHGPVTLQVTESEPYDFFSLLFPEELWDVLVEQTNIYVAQKQRKSWFNDTNKDETKAFVGALVFMAVHRLPNFDHYFSRNWVFAVPAIQNVSTRNRFWQLRQNCHLADNSRQPSPTDESSDQLYKLRPVINVMREKFKQAYNLGQKVCVNKHMVKGKGKNPFKQISSYETDQKGHQNLGIGLFMLWISV